MLLSALWGLLPYINQTFFGTFTNFSFLPQFGTPRVILSHLEVCSSLAFTLLSRWTWLYSLLRSWRLLMGQRLCAPGAAGVNALFSWANCVGHSLLASGWAQSISGIPPEMPCIIVARFRFQFQGWILKRNLIWRGRHSKICHHVPRRSSSIAGAILDLVRRLVSTFPARYCFSRCSIGTLWDRQQPALIFIVFRSSGQIICGLRISPDCCINMSSLCYPLAFLRTVFVSVMGFNLGCYNLCSVCLTHLWWDRDCVAVSKSSLTNN